MHRISNISLRTSSFVTCALRILVLLLLAGCNSEPEVFGSSKSGFDHFPETPISVDDALKVANPYLDTTYNLRIADRERKSNGKPKIWITLKGDNYYVVKDKYPSYSPGFYLEHAVVVNTDTDEVTPPQ